MWGSARRGVWLVAGLVTVLEVAFAGGYGYHRDEFYFVASGQHLAPGYVDQGPLVPLLARLMTTIAPDSLYVLRLPSALAVGALVLVTAAIVRELEGDGRAELIAAVGMGLSSMALFDGHLLETSTVDLLVWAVASWLVLRVVRTGNNRLWLLVGVVLGVGLLNKPLPAFLGVAVLIGIAVAGPRRVLRSPYVWLGAVIAVLIGLPWVLWQAGHGWPELAVSRSIAGGGSTSSQPWYLVIPFQFLLVSPLLAPVLVVGWWRLWRPQTRFLAIAWVVLAVVFMVTGGKPYYLGGLLPLIVAAGAVAARSWPARVLWAAIAAGAAVNLLVSLPILPARATGSVIALNPDVGETIGWPDFVRTVVDVRHRLPADAPVVIVTGNYGEAGALQHFGVANVYSGHNSYGDWGPPPPDGAPVIAVGAALGKYLRDCTSAARISNSAGIHNHEYGVQVMICAGPRTSWAAEWPGMKHIG